MYIGNFTGGWGNRGGRFGLNQDQSPSGNGLSSAQQPQQPQQTQQTQPQPQTAATSPSFVLPGETVHSAQNRMAGTGQSADQSTDQSADQSADQSTGLNKTMGSKSVGSSGEASYGDAANSTFGTANHQLGAPMGKSSPGALAQYGENTTGLDNQINPSALNMAMGNSAGVIGDLGSAPNALASLNSSRRL